MKLKKSPSRLNAYLAAGVGASATLATQSDASIVYFDVNPDRTFGENEALTFGSINLSNGTYVLNGNGGTTFGLDFRTEGGGIEGYLTPLGNVQWGFTGSYIERLSSNTDISSTSASSWGAAPSAYLFSGYLGAGGNWGFTGPNDSITGYAPLRIDAGGGNYHYGWVEITTEVGNVWSPPYVGTATVTVTGFAFNTNLNEAIQAGAIPEPSTLACLLLGGSAFAFSRRRRLESLKQVS